MQSTAIKMMDGSSTTQSYMLIGRKGNMAIGFKIIAVMAADSFGTPNHTWIAAKLRVAPLAKDNSDDGETVVQFSNALKYEKPADALPEITWQKSSSGRASTVIGILVPGAPAGSSEMIDKFIAETADNAISKKFVAYFDKIIGAAFMTATSDEITGFVQPIIDKVITKAQQAIKVQENFKEAMAGSVGTVAVEADLLKKAYKLTTSETGDEDPDDDFDDENYTDKDFGDQD